MGDTYCHIHSLIFLIYELPVSLIPFQNFRVTAFCQITRLLFNFVLAFQYNSLMKDEYIIRTLKEIRADMNHMMRRFLQPERQENLFNIVSTMEEFRQLEDMLKDGVYRKSMVMALF